jgi:hypothetical protein
MRYVLRSLGWTVAVAALALARFADAAAYRPPRTESRAPDLQGLWDSNSLTNLARPAEYKSVIASDAEAAAYERGQNDWGKLAADFKKALPRAPDVGGFETEFKPQKTMRLARIAGQARSSILIDPPDGRVPLLPAVRDQLKTRRLQEARNFDSAELRPLAERCIGIPGPPMVGGDQLQIVQTRDHIAMVTDSGAGARIIRMKDRRHGPPQIKPWMGDSVGWWDGDTLVVETTNFNPGTAYWAITSRMPLSPGARVTERFSRTSPTEILYRFTVEDPANYAKPWSGVMPYKADEGRQLSYECHEGNYALANILAGARKAERDGGAPEPIDGGDEPPKPVVAAGATAPRQGPASQPANTSTKAPGPAP